MSTRRPAHKPSLTRRHLLGTLSAGAAFACMGGYARAQDAANPPPAEPVAPAQLPFSFDTLTAEMRDAATRPMQGAQLPESFLNQLDYDAYRLIRFNPERARFADAPGSRFRLHAFHMGWLFKEPVLLYEVSNGQAWLMGFDTDDFMYEREARERVPEHVALPGVAGFRLHTPINRPDIFDELVAFQGASYFRALGRDSAYGLSARGLAVNTGLPVAEEFPRFSRFWIQKPEPGSNTLAVWASLDSPSLTGAYQFVITPGEETLIDVTARLFFRSDIQQLGIAPLTSMFLFGSRNRNRFDDFRPQVHDSDGLMIQRDDGEKLWRPLSNPRALASSYFVETTPRAFGLLQRDRDFDHYQDAAAIYERRPSCLVEPIGDWGKGMVRLVEIPSESEVNDNIVVFWVPDTTAKAGQTMDFSYRLRFGDLPPDPHANRAYVVASRAGLGGVSGLPNTDGSRKFVIDFAGGTLARFPAAQVDQLQVVATASQGEIINRTLQHVPESDVWRMVLDVRPQGNVVELSAHVAGFDQKLTETWLYQWINA